MGDSMVRADRDSRDTTARSLAGLDGVNFFLADVASGLGPFLAVYLLARRDWNAASIGVILTIGGIAGLAAQTPAGAIIDATQHKRAWLIGTTALISVSVFLVTLVPNFAVITIAQMLLGVAAAIFPPTLAAIALGIVGPKNYTSRTGRMQAFNHAGNVFAAAIAGLAGYLVAVRSVFWLVSILAIFVIIAALTIDPRVIDNRQARGLAPGQDAGERPSGLKTLIGSRPLRTFAITILVFHLANAAMLPIMGQKLAIGNTGQETLFLAALIIVAQLVMSPMSILVGRHADSWDARPSSWPRSSHYRYAVCCSRCPTTRGIWSRSRSSTASPPGSSAPCSHW